MTNSKLDILFLSADKFPPYRVDVSVLFGQEIAGNGHTIDWILQSDTPLARKTETPLFNGTAHVGAKGSGGGAVDRLKTLVFGVAHDFTMFSVLTKKKYDLLIVKDKFIAGVAALIAARLFNVKMVYWLSFPFPEDSFFRVKDKAVRFPILYWLRGMFFHVLLYGIVLRCCDHAFVQTEYMREKIAGKGIRKSKMTPVPMAVSVKDIPFYGYAEKSPSNQSAPIVVYLGTLIKIRRMDFLLRAFKKVLMIKGDAQLYLVGGSEIPSDEENLRLDAEKLGIDRSVTITGFLPQKEAWEYIKDADVCVSPIYPSPSFDVGSPTKLLEYMAMGKASVANDHPEQEVVIHESGAGICVPYDENAFADAMLYLIDNPNVASKMGYRGRAYIKENRNYSTTANFVEGRLLDVAG